MGHSLDQISITGFKSIRNLDSLELKPLNLLVGANGSGKSNFLAVFKLLNQLVDQRLQTFIGTSGGADELLYFGQKETDRLGIRLKFGPNEYQFALVPAAGDRLVFEYEDITFQDPGYSIPYRRSLGSGQIETRLFEDSESSSQPRISDDVIGAIKSWRIYHFHDTSPSAQLKKSANLNDNERLRADGSNLAPFLLWMREKYPEHYQKIRRTIQLAAPFFDDFVLRANPLNPQAMLLEWREKGSDAYFNADAMSDGTLRFICLATLLLQPELPSTILIDEPELGLHPYAVQVLASLLRSAAVETQVVVSTQSVQLINQFEPEDILVVDRKDRQSTFTRLSRSDLGLWLDDYGMGDLWEKNLLGGRPA